MKNSADFGCTFTCRSYGAKWLSDLVSINMTPLTGLESEKVISPTVSGMSRLSAIDWIFLSVVMIYLDSELVLCRF